MHKPKSIWITFKKVLVSIRKIIQKLNSLHNNAYAVEKETNELYQVTTENKGQCISI